MEKNGVVLGRASLSAGWWVIFEHILYRVAKQDLNHSSYERSTLKEAKNVWNLAVLGTVGTVPINVSQILLNPPRRVFSNTFRRSSNWSGSYHFSTWYYFAPWCFHCLFHMLNDTAYTEAVIQSTALHLIELLHRRFLGNSPKKTNQLFFKNLFGWLLSASKWYFF